MNFVIGGLLFEEARKGKNPFTTGINVEDVFNAVQLLAERNSLEASPFIQSWDSTVDNLDNSNISLSTLENVFETFAEKYFEELRKIINPSIEYGGSIYGTPRVDLRNELKELRRELQVKSGEGKIFRETANEMILTLKNLVWAKDLKKILYLTPILNLLRKQNRLVISTLNYDNCIELMAEHFREQCETGIDEWSQNGSISPKESGLSLIKLHGSIDWKKQRVLNNLMEG